MKCNISAWCRQTLTDHAKKRIAGFGLLCTLLLAGILSSCTDDEFPEAGMNAMQTRSVLRATNPRGLVQQPNGTWMSQKCRVPIVGPGRIVTYIDGESVDEGVAGNNTIENAVDTDLSNYTTTSTKIVNVDVNAYTPIISIRDTHHTYSAGQKVGFIFKETIKGLLTADVLNGITIQTFLHGSDDPQETIVAKGGGNSLLNLNLLSITTAGGDISDREISFEATKNFDEVRLCLHGIGADVISSSMDISVKYAFVGENREIRATSEDKFKDYWSSGAPTIGSNFFIINEGNIVDSDIGNSAPFTSEGWLLTSYATVNFHKTIPAGTEIGFRYSSVKLADISLLGKNAPTISTYNDKNEEIESSTPNTKLLGIGVIQNTRDAYISIQTTEPCTQVRFTHPREVVDLGGMNVYYAYVREPVKLDPVRPLTLTGGITHLCKGNAALIPVESTTLPGGSELSLAWENRDRENENTGTTNCTLSEDGKILRVDDAASWEEGRYYVDILQGEDTLWKHAEVYVHPKETTWKPQGNSTDWNRWENWDPGSPWECTDVILPSDASIYPILEDGAENRCHNLYFEPGSELENTPAFSANNPNGKVFVDTEVKGGNYSLFSAPLSGMVTGDMFVSSGPLNPFATLDESSYPERRVSPIVYQRFWSKTVEMATPGSGGTASNKQVTIDQTDWSKTFNAVNTVYGAAQGFSVRPGREGESESYTFRFPKEHTTYHYFYSNGASTGQSATINRNGQAGQFIQKTFGSVNLTIDKSGTRFLFGNPFMTHLDIKKFLAANQSNVNAVEVYDGTQYVSITCDDQGNLISTLEETPTMVAPMEAVFVQAKNEGTSLSLKLTREMFHQKGKSLRTRASRSGYAHSKGSLRMKATVSGESSSCILLCSSRYADAYRASEDITALIDNDAKPAVAIFTVADRKALSIQRMRSATRIPVGFYLKQTGNVSLTFDASDNTWNGWKLKDKQTGRSYPLKGRITLHNVSTGSGRFFLEKVQ